MSVQHLEPNAAKMGLLIFCLQPQSGHRMLKPGIGINYFSTFDVSGSLDFISLGIYLKSIYPPLPPFYYHPNPGHPRWVPTSPCSPPYLPYLAVPSLALEIKSRLLSTANMSFSPACMWPLEDSGPIGECWVWTFWGAACLKKKVANFSPLFLQH